jgi:hypothetical protein
MSSSLTLVGDTEYSLHHSPYSCWFTHCPDHGTSLSLLPFFLSKPRLLFYTKNGVIEFIGNSQYCACIPHWKIDNGRKHTHSCAFTCTSPQNGKECISVINYIASRGDVKIFLCCLYVCPPHLREVKFWRKSHVSEASSLQHSECYKLPPQPGQFLTDVTAYWPDWKWNIIIFIFWDSANSELEICSINDIRCNLYITVSICKCKYCQYA